MLKRVLLGFVFLFVLSSSAFAGGVVLRAGYADDGLLYIGEAGGSSQSYSSAGAAICSGTLSAYQQTTCSIDTSTVPYAVISGNVDAWIYYQGNEIHLVDQQSSWEVWAGNESAFAFGNPSPNSVTVTISLQTFGEHPQYAGYCQFTVGPGEEVAMYFHECDPSANWSYTLDAHIWAPGAPAGLFLHYNSYAGWLQYYSY